jgi:hypothetical protein
LPTRERAQLLGQDAVGQPQIRADARRLALRGIPAEGGETVLQVAVAAHEGGVVGALGELHLHLGDVGDELVQPAGGQHPVARGDVEVARARVLGQVAHRATPRDGAAVGRALTGQDAKAGGLAGAVAPDQTDAVAGLDAQRGGFEQYARASTQLEVSCGNHELGTP